MDMHKCNLNELRGMVAEGCQGHAEANAALAELARRAAAAPELAEALAYMLDLHEGDDPGADSETAYDATERRQVAKDRALTAARAALAKAGK